MSFDPTLLTVNHVLAIKAETTSGTPVSLGASDCSLLSNVMDLKIDADIKPIIRQGQQYASKLLTVPGARGGKISFKTEFFSTSGAPAWATLLFGACALNPSGGVFTPFTVTPSQPQPTITIGVYQAGRLKTLAGCAGNFKINAKSGERIYLEWTFEGVWQAPVTAAIPGGITYPSTQPTIFGGVTITLGGQGMHFPDFEFDAGNKLYLRQDQAAVDGAGNPTGYRAAIVTNREPMLKISPESYQLTAVDFFAAHIGQTTYNFAFTTGASGNQMQFSAPKAQLNNPPGDADRSGIMADVLQFICTRTSGDDDYTITCS